MRFMRKTIRLLLVDDHPFVRYGVRMPLEATGHIAVVLETDRVNDAIRRTAQLTGHQTSC